ncbi:MAG TPA: glycosyltransferase family 39 protein [Verrucomicrobiae bacterium]|nr:glycosyltransferase family 39 protein [Verrucomicrobiae bacterium]
MSETTAPPSAAEPAPRAQPGTVVFSANAILAMLTALAIVLHALAIRNYGFFRDELYYMACGRHLAWGYVDQPPLVALIAWISHRVFGNSLAAIRVFPALAGAATVCLTGLFARELGGNRFSQFLAAMAVLFAPACLAFTGFFSMNAFEPLFWLGCAWIAVRIAGGASPRLWILFGAIAGVGVENKHTMIVFGFALVCGLMLAGQARLFKSPWFWLGGCVAFLIFLPNLHWEIVHGFPQIEVVRNAQKFKNEKVGAGLFLFDQALFVQPLTYLLCLTGIAWVFLEKEGKRFVFLAWTYFVILAVFIALDGKSYYVVPADPILIALGAVAFGRIVSKPAFRGALVALILAGGLIALPLGLPILPVPLFLRYLRVVPYGTVKTERDATVALPQLYADMFGWENIADRIAEVYNALPANERPGCAIAAGNYGEAGAIDYYGPALGLPPAISGHNSYYDWGPRNYSGDCVILFGERSTELTQYFREVERVGTVSNPHSMPSERNVPIYLCHKPIAPLAELWPHFRMII